MLTKNKKNEITHNSEVFILGINLNESNYTATVIRFLNILCSDQIGAHPKIILANHLVHLSSWVPCFTRYKLYIFPNFEDTNITSDAEWGCMLRAGQMIFA